MVQAYVDDSKSEGSPPFFILGGYIATAETWARFSEEWQRALDMRPRIPYFKYREALRGEGEFNGASEALRMERASVMRGVIELFDLAEFGIGFRVDAYEKAFARFGGQQATNPYYFATANLMAELARGLEQLLLPRERLDIIFDNQMMEKDKVIAAWEWATKATAKPIPSDILTEILRNPPTWRDDKDVLPLQAADMHATWLRIDLENQRDGRPRKTMPGARRQLRGMGITFTEAELIARADRMEADIQRYNSLPPL
jgi:hypothetical protein